MPAVYIPFLVPEEETPMPKNRAGFERWWTLLWLWTRFLQFVGKEESSATVMSEIMYSAITYPLQPHQWLYEFDCLLESGVLEIFQVWPHDGINKVLMVLRKGQLPEDAAWEVRIYCRDINMMDWHKVWFKTLFKKTTTTTTKSSGFILWGSSMFVPHYTAIHPGLGRYFIMAPMYP